jgi:hypothetical protein
LKPLGWSLRADAEPREVWERRLRAGEAVRDHLGTLLYVAKGVVVAKFQNLEASRGGVRWQLVETNPVDGEWISIRQSIRSGGVELPTSMREHAGDMAIFQASLRSPWEAFVAWLLADPTYKRVPSMLDEMGIP